ncbi:uncharacterized protein LOC121728763 [Aricia agestis]|uniref:uncharacterized protein LOC121728763 n=1 Tax=Aricia agestis TaxID=91739 RepID=UPI001C205A77|nr:uncharacterized protein LOC121728763 [Aricia agestis]
MRCVLLCVVLCVLGSEGQSTKEYEVKSGTFPYMAIAYYTDDTILEDGRRFIRNAILIRPDWLVSVNIEVHDNTTFPRKTLVARAGADSVDANFTLYEEEMEQDREIIQVVQSKEKMGSWGDTFLALLKTMVPFNTTSMVAPAALPEKIQDLSGKSCFIVVFGYSNSSVDQILMKWTIEILQRDSCKTNDSNVICSSYNTSEADLGLCPRNRGGPLVCEETVVGVQSYLSGCQQPHLHVAVASRGFIECGIQEQCQASPCSNMCSAYDKDSPMTVGARRTDAMTVATTVTTTDPTDTETLNIEAVENKTSVPVNESFAFLKEEIKETSDIIANLGNVDIANLTSPYTQVNLTSEPEITPSVPTRTAVLRMGDNDIKINFPKKTKTAIARTSSRATMCVEGFSVTLATIVSFTLL